MASRFTITLARMTSRHCHRGRGKWNIVSSTIRVAVWPTIASQRRMISVLSDKPRLRRGKLAQFGGAGGNCDMTSSGEASGSGRTSLWFTRRL